MEPTATPTQFVAFLRAINVGGHTVKMAQLRTLFVVLGFANVETFIASGNVIFEAQASDTHALEGQIERHLRQALGYVVTTFIRSTSELALVAQHQPFAATDLDAHGSGLYIAFLPTPPSAAAQQKLLDYRSALDDFQVHGREVYWLCRTRMSDSTFSGALLEKVIGMLATMRNATTVCKLAAKYPGLAQTGPLLTP